MGSVYMSPIAKKGQFYVRRQDGFVFKVKNASKASQGAALFCVDATMIYGWYTFAEIALKFDRLSEAQARKLVEEQNPGFKFI